MEIVWSGRARQKVASVEAYYLEKTEGYADVFVSGILNATRRLERFPESGRIVPEINHPDFREVIWGKNWRIIYLLPSRENEPIEILNVLHTSQRFEAL